MKSSRKQPGAISRKPAPKTTRSVLERLERAIAGATGFSLLVCAYSSCGQREAAIARLKTGKRTVRLGPETPDSTQRLFEHLNEVAGGSAVHLVGAEEWPRGFEDLMSRLNNRRNAIPVECPHPIVLWLTDESADWLARNAADLWAWRGALFSMDDESTLARQEYPSP